MSDFCSQALNGSGQARGKQGKNVYFWVLIIFFFSPTISTLFGQAAASAALIKALILPGLTKPSPAVSALERVLAIVLCSKQAQKARISPQNSTLRAFSAFLLLASSPFLKICA